MDRPPVRELKTSVCVSLTNLRLGHAPSTEATGVYSSRSRTECANASHSIRLRPRALYHLPPLPLPRQAKARLWDRRTAPNTPGGRRPNLAKGFVDDFRARLGLAWVADGKGNREEKTFGPEDVFNYVYAIFHSPNTASATPSSSRPTSPGAAHQRAELFRSLGALGDQLVGTAPDGRKAPPSRAIPSRATTASRRCATPLGGEDPLPAFGHPPL